MIKRKKEKREMRMKRNKEKKERMMKRKTHE